jgi:hypothetical protein
VEAQRQAVDMAEDVLRKPPRRILADALEDGVAEMSNNTPAKRAPA